MSEKIPSSEWSVEEMSLIEALRENSKNLETKDQLIQLIIKKENWADQQNTPRANMEVNLWRAKLYLTAGLRGEAKEAFDDVWTQAHNEGEEDILVEIETIMNSLSE